MNIYKKKYLGNFNGNDSYNAATQLHNRWDYVVILYSLLILKRTDSSPAYQSSAPLFGFITESVTL